MKLNYKVLTITIFIVAFILAGAFWSKADGVGTYSEGYRFGQLFKFGVKKGFLGQTASGEGAMLCGVESTPISVTVKGDKKTPDTVNIINPWAFSSRPDNKAMHKQLSELQGEYVIMKYRQAQAKYPNVDTDYEIDEVLPVGNEKLTTAVAVPNFLEVYGIDDDSAKLTQKSKSKLVGRFVKVSKKGKLIDSMEVTFQQGNSGSLFKDLSVRNQDVYNAAMVALKSGQKVKVFYIETYVNLDITGRNTPYEIVKIEPFNEKKFE